MLIALLHVLIYVIVAVIIIKLLVWGLSQLGLAIPAQIEKLFYVLVAIIAVIDVLMILLGGSGSGTHAGFLP